MARFFMGLILLLMTVTTYVLWGTGITRTIEHRFDGKCLIVQIPAPEDIVFEPRTDVAWVAAIDGTEAGIYAMRMGGAQQANWALAKLDGIDPFTPLGLSVWTDASGVNQLFAINRENRTVEIFAIEAFAQLRHLRTVQDALIRYPNDLTATGPESFYATNTHESAPNTPERLIEMVLRLERGDVIHFDGQRARIVAQGIGYANGNVLSPDGQTFYVSSVATSEIHRFRRLPDNSLETIDRIATPGGPDNLDMRPDGSFTAALHPRSLDALRYLSGGATSAPSRVVHVTPAPEDKVQVIYDDPGQEISAASVAATSGNRLLIGAVAGDHLLDCRMNSG